MSFQVIAITKPAMYLFMEIQKIDSSYYPEVYMKKEGPAAKLYIKWAASMVTSLDTSVPCVMYMQADAPNPIVAIFTNITLLLYMLIARLTHAIEFTAISSYQTLMLSQRFRSRAITDDLAFAVARFYQLGGIFMNYYMYHEGTNFSRTTGGLFVSTSYDYDAPLDEYGIIRQPKWGHLKDLHNFIKLCEEALIATDPAVTSFHPNVKRLSSSFQTKQALGIEDNNVSPLPTIIIIIIKVGIDSSLTSFLLLLLDKRLLRCLESMQKISIINRFQAWQMLK
ncbi:hypothetical protein Ahy_B08g090733 [Arachis hypogaea]|uniref:beta-galactosidase n=1 Tax=Arachis hypogaea TaxID=3818 RepID=A0A444Y0J6_ARAHY|nr:hypothetical protein Ahy_B08g090733 [Arachis hypogaea]